MKSTYTPERFRQAFEERSRGIPDSELIRGTKHEDLKEAYCAQHFGTGYQRLLSSCTLDVDLEENGDADFILGTEKGEFRFQTTMALKPGRRMADEYKPADTIFSRPYRPEEGRIEGPNWIASAVARKVKKRYPTAVKLNLLAYANFDAHEMNCDHISRAIGNHRNKFASIWILTSDMKICSISSTPQLGHIKKFRSIYNAEELLAS